MRPNDKQGHISLTDEYNRRTYVAFDRQKKETIVITDDGRKVYGLGDMLISFLSMGDNPLLPLYEEDRLRLIEALPLADASAFEWDLSDKLDGHIEAYLTRNSISKDEFAKKLLILDFVKWYEELHPYFSMLDLYTAILPCGNDTLMRDVLNINLLMQKAADLAAFCLDMDMEHLNKLTAVKRYYYFHASGRGGIPQGFRTRIVVLPEKIPADDYDVFYKRLPVDFEARRLWEVSSVHELMEPQDVSGMVVEHMESVDAAVYEAYEISAISDLVYLELYQMILADIKIRRCALCGKYFVAKGNYNGRYCDRKIKGKRLTCQNVGSSRDFSQREKDDIGRVQYMKAYKRLHSRIKYGMLTKEGFKEWNGKAQRELELYKNGDITLEDFKAWLGNRD